MWILVVSSSSQKLNEKSSRFENRVENDPQDALNIDTDMPFFSAYGIIESLDVLGGIPMSKVVMIFTGGTISMKINEGDHSVVPAFSANEIMLNLLNSDLYQDLKRLNTRASKSLHHAFQDDGD
ncbi:MAG: hypothetical protein MZU97_24780 [Bacillus subtilis]|nr:hypothetical protein [Bacillus subtilis]